jgi:hypothetical protein
MNSGRFLMAKELPSPAQQLERILKRYGQINQYSSIEARVEIITSMVAAIERLAPKGTFYYNSLESATKNRGLTDYSVVPLLGGIIQSLKTAYESGYLHQVEELIHADLFSDFLEMGEYLLKDGFKDPAAVIIGGVLEEHLRKLCLKSSIDTEVSGRPKKAEAMNQELAKAGTYNVLDQKNVTAWLDLRNKVAHGKFTEYTVGHVQLALSGIRDFISRVACLDIYIELVP